MDLATLSLDGLLCAEAVVIATLLHSGKMAEVADLGVSQPAISALQIKFDRSQSTIDDVMYFLTTQHKIRQNQSSFMQTLV